MFANDHVSKERADKRCLHNAFDTQRIWFTQVNIREVRFIKRSDINHFVSIKRFYMALCGEMEIENKVFFILHCL